MKRDVYAEKVAGFSVGDPINDLGFQLRRQIPKGEDRRRWLSTKTGQSEAMNALRNAGYTGNHLARAMFDISFGEIRLPLTITTQADMEALDGGVLID